MSRLFTDSPGDPVVKKSPSKAASVCSIPGWELRFHMPRGQKTKTENRNNILANSKKTKNGPHQEKKFF